MKASTFAVIAERPQTKLTDNSRKTGNFVLRIFCHGSENEKLFFEVEEQNEKKTFELKHLHRNQKFPPFSNLSN
jgi:hypothetical protein